MSRVVEVIAHSEGKEARKLEGSQSSETHHNANLETYILGLEVEKTTSTAILTWEKGFLGDFTLAGRYNSLRLLIYMHPSSFKSFENLENMYLQKITIQSQKCNLFRSQERESGTRVRNAILGPSQERESGTSSNRLAPPEQA